MTRNSNRLQTTQGRSKPVPQAPQQEEATVTFANVGRLHAFLKERRKANGWRATAPLAAMEYILRLERLCAAARDALAKDPDGQESLVVRIDRTLAHTDKPARLEDAPRKT